MTFGKKKEVETDWLGRTDPKNLENDFLLLRVVF